MKDRYDLGLCCTSISHKSLAIIKIVSQLKPIVTWSVAYFDTSQKKNSTPLLLFWQVSVVIERTNKLLPIAYFQAKLSVYSAAKG